MWIYTKTFLALYYIIENKFPQFPEEFSSKMNNYKNVESV